MPWLDQLVFVRLSIFLNFSDLSVALGDGRDVQIPMKCNKTRKAGMVQNE